LTEFLESFVFLAVVRFALLDMRVGNRKKWCIARIFVLLKAFRELSRVFEVNGRFGFLGGYCLRHVQHFNLEKECLFESCGEISLVTRANLSRGTTDAVAKYKGIQNSRQPRLVGQNMMIHNLAYKIQILCCLIQDRIKGLGKPFQLAARDFLALCLEARAMGIGLKELDIIRRIPDRCICNAEAAILK